MASFTLILGQFHDDSKTTTTTTTTEKEETIHIRSSSSRTTDIQYHPPFTTQYYPVHVVDVLQQYPKTTIFSSDDEQDDDDSNVEEMRQLELASWYVDLGIAHRTVLEDYYMERLDNDNDMNDTNRAVYTKMNDMDNESTSSRSGSSTTNHFIQVQKAYSVATFQEAMHIYETLIQNYHQWLESYIEKNKDEFSIQEKSVAATTKNIIQQLIQEYELLLANTIFALAETYTLVNDDTRLAFRYYHRAYQIYQQIHQTNQFTQNTMEHENNRDDYYQSDNNDRNMEIHLAHCSMQLGLESLQNLHDIDHDMIKYDANDGENHAHITLSLSDVLEKSILTFDHHFWKTLITSFPWKDNDDDDKNKETIVDDMDNDTQLYTREVVQDYLRNHYIDFFNNDVARIEMYILQYILTEQAIVYFTDAINIFRQVIQQQQLSTIIMSGDNEATTTVTSRHNLIIEHQQTLVSALQNLGICLYEYRPHSSTISKAVEYYEEAYDLLSLQIIPSLLLHQPTKENHRNSHGSNDDVKRTVHTMIDILFILTEMYFQLGDDELSKERMQMCLQHHEEYQLDPPSIDPLLHGSTMMIEEMLVMDDNETPMSRKDLLTQYEQLLEEYFALVADNDMQQQNSMNDDQMLLMDESNGYYYEKDDSYEADIHVSIGTLYMEEFDKAISTSSITHAMTHFEQAVRLYEMSGDVDSNTNMALAKYNLFLLHLRGGNYRMAARRYNDAIDLFRNIESHSIGMTGIYESFKDPTLFTGSATLQQHRSKRIQEPYQSSKQQHKTLTKSEASTTRTTSPTARAIDKETKHNFESATVLKEKLSIYVDLQNFLSQNQSATEEL